MSSRKPSAPRLLPSFSKTTGLSSSATWPAASWSTTKRRCCVAATAWSRPSTDSTPRICDSDPVTVPSIETSSGLRKYWSRCFSASASVEWSSSTTLPMVWWSLTRRYSSSTQVSRGSGGWSASTWSRRCARRSARSRISAGLTSSDSRLACRYSTAVATSIAIGVEGGVPVLTRRSVTRPSAAPSSSAPICSLCSDSRIRWNWSATGLIL